MKDNLVQNTMDSCRDTGFLYHPLVLLATFLTPIQSGHSWRLRGRFRKQAQYRHKCRMTAIEVEADTKIRKCLIGRSRLVKGDYVLGDAENYWKASQGVHQFQGHWIGLARVIDAQKSNLARRHIHLSRFFLLDQHGTLHDWNGLLELHSAVFSTSFACFGLAISSLHLLVF